MRTLVVLILLLACNYGIWIWYNFVLAAGIVGASNIYANIGYWGPLIFVACVLGALGYSSSRNRWWIGGIPALQLSWALTKDASTPIGVVLTWYGVISATCGLLIYMGFRLRRRPVPAK